MGYERVSLDDVDCHELDDIEPDVLPIGVELRPEAMRPSVWAYEAGESSTRHYQREQEELYVPLEGEFELAFEGGEGATEDEDKKESEEWKEDGERNDEMIDLEPGDYVVVDPETVRRVTAVTDGRLLVVGAPNAKDDGVVVE